MSIARVYTTQKSRKDQKPCGKCGVELPKGTGYKYFYVGFRSNFKQVRCLKPECSPRQSELESSKVASFYAAQETFEDNIDSLDTKDDIEAAVQEVAEACGSLRDEYQEGLDAWEHGNEQMQEKVDHWDSMESELNSWTFDGNDEPDHCDEHASRSDWEDDEVQECADCQEKREEWLDEIREAAREAVNNVEVM